jgi:hypothetical protein
MHEVNFIYDYPLALILSMCVCMLVRYVMLVVDVDAILTHTCMYECMQVTLLVKQNMPGQITLAIGDGANDVSMIQVRACVLCI